MGQLEEREGEYVCVSEREIGGGGIMVLESVLRVLKVCCLLRSIRARHVPIDPRHSTPLLFLRSSGCPHAWLSSPLSLSPQDDDPLTVQ